MVFVSYVDNAWFALVCCWSDSRLWFPGFMSQPVSTPSTTFASDASFAAAFGSVPPAAASGKGFHQGFKHTSFDRAAYGFCCTQEKLWSSDFMLAVQGKGRWYLHGSTCFALVDLVFQSISVDGTSELLHDCFHLILCHSYQPSLKTRGSCW